MAATSPASGVPSRLYAFHYRLYSPFPHSTQLREISADPLDRVSAQDAISIEDPVEHPMPLERGRQRRGAGQRKAATAVLLTGARSSPAPRRKHPAQACRAGRSCR